MQFMPADVPGCFRTRGGRLLLAIAFEQDECCTIGVFNYSETTDTRNILRFALDAAARRRDPCGVGVHVIDAHIAGPTGRDAH